VQLLILEPRAMEEATRPGDLGPRGWASSQCPTQKKERGWWGVPVLPPTHNIKPNKSAGRTTISFSSA
uniref:Uncharacterized protein n=1 Tax=Leptobrachium leishanense TaxID=445787 RepID=A0A8C5PVC2_9ANUR